MFYYSVVDKKFPSSYLKYLLQHCIDIKEIRVSHYTHQLRGAGLIL